MLPSRTTRLARGKRLRPVSAKTRRAKPGFDAVYREVDARSGGRCEVSVKTELRAAPWFLLPRCGEQATEHHHLFKPRRGSCELCGLSHLGPHHRTENILHVCERHHAEFEPRAYRDGRRVPTAFDAERGCYRTEVRYAASKFEARQLES